MALNNQQVSVESTVTKNLQSGVSGTVNPVVSYVQQDARVTMNFTPLISYNNTVNMQINLTLNIWQDPTDPSNGTYNNRTITTNVSLRNGDVLVLGGLLNDRAIALKSSVPFFERIPIIGNLFASRSKTMNKKQLYIVIRTTVVEPRTHAGMRQITKYSADYMVEQLAETEEVFGNLKDPITRWFFTSNGKETASVRFDKAVNALSEEDYQEDGLPTDLHHATWNEKSAQKGGHMRLGWFSDVESNLPGASAPATSEDMQNVEKLLQSIENPFNARFIV